MYVRCAELRCRILRLPVGNTARSASKSGGRSKRTTAGSEDEESGKKKKQLLHTHANGAERRYLDTQEYNTARNAKRR